jgi:hypothetical protein
MKGGAQILAGAALLLGAPTPPPPTPFAVASVRFEQNATDGDVEVVFEVKGGGDGLAKLAVVSPDGRTVINFTAPEASTLGIRQFRFESPEPSDVARLKAAYPEGVYRFTGTTAAGQELVGASTLHHKLPPPASFLRPAADARDVSVRDLEIAWTPVNNLAAYIVYVEQPDLGVEITARLPGSATAFAVPNGLLVPGEAYQLGIGTVTPDGNISFVETTFTTAPKE